MISLYAPELDDQVFHKQTFLIWLRPFMKREWVAVIIKSVLNNFQNVLDLLDLYFQTTKTSSVSTLFYLKNVIFNDETSNKILNFCFNLLIFSWILRILSIFFFGFIKVLQSILITSWSSKIGPKSKNREVFVL